jgi:hypothetical protein
MGRIFHDGLFCCFDSFGLALNFELCERGREMGWSLFALDL